MLELAASAQCLRGLVHVSSAFVNMNVPRGSIIDEAVYPLRLGRQVVDVEQIAKVGVGWMGGVGRPWWQGLRSPRFLQQHSATVKAGAPYGPGLDSAFCLGLTISIPRDMGGRALGCHVSLHIKLPSG